MKDIVKENTSNKIKNYISFFAIICTVLSFHPNSELQSLFSRGYLFLWLTVIVFSFIKNQIKFDKLFTGMAVAFVICYISTFLANWTGVYEVKSSIGVGMYLVYCIAFYFIGYNSSDSQDFGDYAIKAFCYGAFAIVVITQFSGFNFFQKNQTGQIFGVFNVILAADIFVLDISRKKKYLYFFIMLLTSLTLIMNGARTSIMAVLIAETAMMLKTSIFKENKVIWIVFIWIAIVFMLKNNNTINELFGGFSEDTGKMSATEIFTKLDFKDAINVVTNGRIKIWEGAIAWFVSSPIFGVGAWAYVDNFVFHILAAGGLVYALALFPITYGTMFKVYKSVGKIDFSDEKDKKISEIIRYLVIFYFIESLMEGYPPLGPGAASFFLWLVLGFYNGRKDIVFAENT